MPDTSTLAVRRAEALEVIAGVVEERGRPERAERIESWRGVPEAVRGMGYRIQRLPEYGNAEFIFARKAAA